MYTFFVCLAILAIGYYFYSRYVEKVFGADPNRETPAIAMADGVDYVALPWWKVFLIQFLNIAGLGPIFGAIAGAMWGPVAFIWIVLGSLIGGGVHDYFSGMLSLRNKGKTLPEITGKYLGEGARKFTMVFTVTVLILVGAVFIAGPAKLMSDLTLGDGQVSSIFTVQFWTLLILAYYILATMLPVDKIIGKLYPVFGLALLLMAVLVFVVIMWHGVSVPELTLANLRNMHHGGSDFPIFPMLFITIACGAVSGFHATQSPLMARCITNEKQGRRIFYGAMITEAVVAMIWAAVAMSFFGGVSDLNEIMVAESGNAAFVVNAVSTGMLGGLGIILVTLGVVVAPITSGDTAFRGARIIIADFFNWKQGKIGHRLLVSIPLLGIGYALTLMDFSALWRYFAWANQTIAAITLWMVTVYLLQESKNYWVALIPALFMTAVSFTYILIAPEGFRLPNNVSVIGGIAGTVIVLLIIFKTRRYALGLKV
ncbi:MAG TPA: carbon starvation protein A [Membranihabitans sp.]|nr:carbon starvation protein A [Membranihabitans sp.]